MGTADGPRDIRDDPSDADGAQLPLEDWLAEQIRLLDAEECFID